MVSRTVDNVATNYAYDSRGELLSETSPTYACSYTYDPNGNRLTKTLNGATDAGPVRTIAGIQRAVHTFVEDRKVGASFMHSHSRECLTGPEKDGIPTEDGECLDQ